MAKNVLILGMARSGTSMTAAIFSRKGYYIAKNNKNQLQMADKYNPSGYWESDDILTANKGLLAAVGFQHDNTWFHEPISKEQASNIHTLPVLDTHRQLVSSFNTNQPWVWKDPRLCYTLGFWWPLLNQSNTKVLLIKREHKEIYESFQRVKDSWSTSIPKDQIYSRIDSHIEAAENTLFKFNIPYETVNYSDYKNSPAKVAKSLSISFDLDIDIFDLGYKNSANHGSLIGKLSLIPEKILTSPPLRFFKKFIRTIIAK